MLFVKIEVGYGNEHISYMGISKPMAFYANSLDIYHSVTPFEETCFSSNHSGKYNKCVNSNRRHETLFFRLLDEASMYICYDRNTADTVGKLFPDKNVYEIQRVYGVRNPVRNPKDLPTVAMVAWTTHATQLVLSAECMKKFRDYSGKILIYLFNVFNARMKEINLIYRSSYPFILLFIPN